MGGPKLARKAQCLRRARLMAREKIFKAPLERNRSRSEAVVFSSSFIDPCFLRRRYFAMAVLVTITKEAIKEATCHQGGLLSALVKMMKRVKSSCIDDSHCPSMLVIHIVFLFHSGPGLMRPTSFTRIKKKGKINIEG